MLVTSCARVFLFLTPGGAVITLNQSLLNIFSFETRVAVISRGVNSLLKYSEIYIIGIRDNNDILTERLPFKDIFSSKLYVTFIAIIFSPIGFYTLMFYLFALRITSWLMLVLTINSKFCICAYEYIFLVCSLETICAYNS